MSDFKMPDSDSTEDSSSRITPSTGTNIIKVASPIANEPRRRLATFLYQ